eukprot:scaffold58161_cov58-Phaeocystis_antarctica.AAC.3
MAGFGGRAHFQAPGIGGVGVDGLPVGGRGVGALRTRHRPTRTFFAVVSQQTSLALRRAPIGLVLATKALGAHAHSRIGCRCAAAAHSLLGAALSRVVAGGGDRTLGLALEVRGVGVRASGAGSRHGRALLAVVPGRAHLAHQQARLVLVGPSGARVAPGHTLLGCHRSSGAGCLLGARWHCVEATVAFRAATVAAAALVHSLIIGTARARRDSCGALDAVAARFAPFAVGRFWLVLELALFALEADAALREGRFALVGAGAGGTLDRNVRPRRTRMAWRALLAVRDVRRALVFIKVAGRAWGCGGRARLGAAVAARSARLALNLPLDLLELARLAQVSGYRRDAARRARPRFLCTDQARAPRLTEVAAVQGLQAGPVAESACLAWARRGRALGAVAAKLANLGLGLGLGSGLRLGLEVRVRVKVLELASHSCFPRFFWKVPASHLRHVAWSVGEVLGGVELEVVVVLVKAVVEVVGKVVGEVVGFSSCTCAVRLVTLPG